MVKILLQESRLCNLDQEKCTVGKYIVGISSGKVSWIKKKKGEWTTGKSSLGKEALRDCCSFYEVGMHVCVCVEGSAGYTGKQEGDTYEWTPLGRTHLLCFHFRNWKYTTYHKSLVFSFCLVIILNCTNSLFIKKAI